MTETSLQSRLCRCRLLATSDNRYLPDNVFALKQTFGNQCKLLDGGLSPLPMIVPELFDAAATTVGPNSLLHDRGQFAPVQFADTPFDRCSDRIIVRTNRDDHAQVPSCSVAVSDGQAESGRPPALHVFSGDGRIIHRVEIVNPDDALILAAATARMKDWTGSLALLEQENRTQERSGNVISLAPHIRFRRPWEDRTLEDHLDEIIVDGGPMRKRQLERQTARNAARINPAVALHFFDYLARRRLPLAHVFAQTGILQAHIGSIDAVDVLDGYALLTMGRAIAAIEIGQIAQCWVVAYATGPAPITALEFYDDADRCIAALLPPDDDTETTSDWALLLSTLPRV